MILLDNKLKIDFKDQFNDMKKIVDIHYFEGPLLSLMRNSNNEEFLIQWCDSDQKVNRWLIIKINPYEINNYLEKNIGLLSIIKKYSYGIFIDINKEFKVVNSWKYNIPNIPEEYLPKENVFYNEDLIYFDTD